MRANIVGIVFKPDPVQGSGSGFWPGHRVVRVNLYFKKKSKRRRFSKKKEVNGLQPSFAGSPGHDFFYFFFNPARLQPRVGRVLNWPAEPGRVSKLWLLEYLY